MTGVDVIVVRLAEVEGGHEMGKHKKQGHWLMEWRDETSMYDPLAQWAPGSDCYMRDFKAWIPNSISRDDDDAIQSYLEAHPRAYVRT